MNCHIILKKPGGCMTNKNSNFQWKLHMLNTIFLLLKIQSRNKINVAWCLNNQAMLGSTFPSYQESSHSFIQIRWSTEWTWLSLPFYTIANVSIRATCAQPHAQLQFQESHFKISWSKTQFQIQTEDPNQKEVTQVRGHNE